MTDAVTPSAELPSEEEIEDLYEAWLKDAVAAA